uniref:CCHC-type domain-containing protein n=2 Tax=Dunaliella tertiolecta TaxID=3047 RepID=A0A7S3VN04_DUNTE|mmetsp:Transcript_13011/g.35440  ORF Transcript_13011/g.35440 Transcript_13011/m.35440 type:complete len:244 (-) Transcript_13011:448-1179(-)
MSTARGAKLKAEYNRVRTSTSLKANDMWSKTIGQEANPQAGSNAAVEASIYAPTHGGSKRAERQENAQKLIEKAGYNAQVTDYQGLLDLAKTQGSFGTGEKVRGACKRCGGLGHMTRQCTNFVTGHTAAAGPSTVAPGDPVSDRGLLPAPGELSELDDLSSSSSSSDSEAEASRREKKSHKRSRGDDKKRKDKKKEKKRKREGDDDGKKKHKKHKHSKDKKHSKKHKKEKHRKRSSSSSSDSD